jgi:serine/threonine protein kinase
LIKYFKYSNKVDIWALGCVFYEVVFLEKTFANDWIALQKEYQLRIPLRSETVSCEKFMVVASHSIRGMLKHNPAKRPTAEDVLKKLQSIHDLNPSTISFKLSYIRLLVDHYHYALVALCFYLVLLITCRVIKNEVRLTKHRNANPVHFAVKYMIVRFLITWTVMSVVARLRRQWLATVFRANRDQIEEIMKVLEKLSVAPWW